MNTSFTSLSIPWSSTQFFILGGFDFLLLHDAQKEAERAETSIREEIYANRYRTGKEIGFSDYFNKHYLPWAQLNKSLVRDDAGSRGNELKAFFRNTPLRTILVVVKLSLRLA